MNSRAHKSYYVSKSQRLWVYSWWSSPGQKEIPPNSWITSTSAKHWCSFNTVLTSSDQVARFTFPCLDLGDCRSPEFLNATVLLYRQLGSQMPGALILRGIKDEKRWGDNCHAIFKVSGSRMALICSGLPLPPSIHPLLFWGSVFPLAELYLGLSEAKSHSFPSLPHPHKQPGGRRPGDT